MKRYSSNYVYSVQTGLLKYAIIEITNDGIISIIDTNGEFKEIHSLEFHSGLLIVGELCEKKFQETKIKNPCLVNLFSIVGRDLSNVISISSVDFINQKLNQDSKMKILV